jgi:hypothetical protein
MARERSVAEVKVCSPCFRLGQSMACHPLLSQPTLYNAFCHTHDVRTKDNDHLPQVAIAGQRVISELG